MRSGRPDTGARRRLGAIVAIAGGLAALAFALAAFKAEFPRGIAVPLCVLGGLLLAWMALLRRGGARLVAAVLAALLLGVAIGLLIAGDRVLELALTVLTAAISVAGARAAYGPSRGSLERVPPPANPVLFINPRSGDGKAVRFKLAAEAVARGIETVVLEPGDDLETLVREALGRGAGGLAMAGGDGSQALVAAVAAEHELPYACIPSGTRNHFALDLGVDREDPVGALDAFVDGGERLVDLAEVNGRVFVNNASLGVYAEAVNRDEYRGAKLRTLLETIPDAIGPEGRDGRELRWSGPDGTKRHSNAMVLVSNNAYKLGGAVGSGTRPSLEQGVLGVLEVRPPGAAGSGRAWDQLTAESLEVDADGPIPIGVDGESLTMEPPLRFRMRPAALRVRIAIAHPGASPSAGAPESAVDGLGRLLRIAVRGTDS